MSGPISLECPSCGAVDLRKANDADQYICNYCGRKLYAESFQGTISLRPFLDEIKETLGVGKEASELAIRRLKEDISFLESERQNLESNYDDLVRKEESRYDKKVIEFSSLEAKEDKVHRKMIWNAVGVLAVIIYAGYFWSRLPASTPIEQGQLYASTLTLCLLLFAIPAGLFFSIRLLMGISTSRQINTQVNDLSSDMEQVREEVNETIHELHQKKHLEVEEIDKKIMRKQREIANHLNVVSVEGEANNI